MEENYYISGNNSLLNINTIYDYLCNHSYWAKGRSLTDVEKSIENSFCFGLYNSSNNMLGFARVVSDQVAFAYLMDVFVLAEYRDKGLGKMLVQHVINDSRLKVRRWMLGTFHSHDFYQQFGFHQMLHTDRFMEKIDATRI